MAVQPVSFCIFNRPRVDEQLDQMLCYPLTVARAPMGFGKTTTLRDYIDRKNPLNVWISMYGTDGSTEYFWRRLSSQVGKIDSVMGQQLARIGVPNDAAGLAPIVDLVASYQYEQPTLLVIDDYQLVDSPPISNLITLVASEQIVNLHIILLTQEIKSLPIDDMEQKRLCLAVEQDTFRLTQDEIYAYFVLCGHPINDKTVQKIDHLTGGWMQGVCLLMRFLQQGQPIGRQEDMAELLEMHVYASHNEHTRALLCKLSFLDDFTAEQLIYVTGDPDAPIRLSRLLRSNAFLTLCAPAQTYHISPVFRDFLHQKAKQDGVDPVPILYAAGLWFLERGDRMQGYDYLSRAGAVEAILQDMNSEEMKDISYAQYTQIDQIFRVISKEMFRKYPLAVLQYLRVHGIIGDSAARAESVRGLEQMEAYFLKADMPERERGRVLGEIYNQWALLAFNDIFAMLGYAAKAAALLGGRYSCLVSRHTRFTMGAVSMLYCYHTKPGKLRETVRYMAENLHILAETVEGRGAGSESLVLAEYALETGRFHEVERHAQKAICQSELYHQVSIEICATFCLARTAALQGRYSDARALMDKLAEKIRTRNDNILDRMTAQCRMYIDSCTGQKESLVGLGFSSDMDAGSFLRPGTSLRYILSCRSVLLSGSFLRLEVMCEELEKKYKVYQNQLGLIHNGIYLAAAKHRLYGTRAGLETLREVLDIAGADGIAAPFFETAEFVLPLLFLAGATEHCSRAWLDALITGCEAQTKQQNAKSPAPAPALTAREREVLSMLAQGLKHEDIAAQLFISVPTVRYHVKNIYLKLDVNNKVCAVERGKALGVI